MGVPAYIFLKKHEYAEIVNYMGLIAYNSIMYTTIKINVKWQIFLRVLSLDLPKRDDCLVLCIFVPICVLIFCQEVEINRGTTFANDRSEITKQKPIRDIIRWEP